MQQAFHIIPATRDIALFIIGDHASNYIPEHYGNLGLSGADLTRHIAWDIGTETVIRELCRHFGCAGQLAGVSRLVIDLNREPDRDTLIPLKSDGSTIWGNQNLSQTEREARKAQIYAPYHEALTVKLDEMTSEGNITMQDKTSPLILSIHSFTPQVKGQPPRAVDIGLLVRHDVPTAQAFKAAMEAAYDYDVRMNEPYSAYDLNYTVDYHLAPRGLRHLAIELRQDHVMTDDKASEVAAQLAAVIQPLI